MSRWNLDCIRCSTSFDSTLGICPKCHWNPDHMFDETAGFRKGQKVQNRFQIKVSLGTGELGPVLRALDEKTGDDVALKVIHPALLPTTNDVATFIRKIRSGLTSQQNPMAGIISVNRDAEDRCYIVSKLIEGIPLERLLKNRKSRHQNFSIEEILPIIEQICEFLDDSEAGIHGALSPKKIWILPHRLQVTGMEIAQHLPPAAVWHRLRSHRVSANYVAPELEFGTPWNKRADVFSVGVLIGELLTGVPYNGIDGYTTSEPALDEFLARALDKNPQNRFKRLHNLLDAFTILDDPQGASVVAGHNNFEEDTLPEQAEKESFSADEPTVELENTEQISMERVIEDHGTESHSQAKTPPSLPEDTDQVLVEFFSEVDVKELEVTTSDDAFAEANTNHLTKAADNDPREITDIQQLLTELEHGDITSTEKFSDEIEIEDYPEENTSPSTLLAVSRLEREAEEAEEETISRLFRHAHKLNGVDPRLVRAAKELEIDKRTTASKKAAEILRKRSEDLDGIDPRLLRAAARLLQSKEDTTPPEKPPLPKKIVPKKEPDESADDWRERMGHHSSDSAVSFLDSPDTKRSKKR